jgi:ribonuclease R
MGDKVRIRVVAANLEKRQLDYDWILTPNTESVETNEGEVAVKEKTKSKRKKKKEEE